MSENHKPKLTEHEKDIVIADMRMLLMRLCRALPADHKYREQVASYIRRKGLSSPFR